MYSYDKKSKPVDTKFVLGELNKIKKAMEELDNRTDYLYASVLVEEVKKHLKSFKTITTSKIQRKFKLGYVRTRFLIDLLEKEGYVSLDMKNRESRGYVVNKKK